MYKSGDKLQSSFLDFDQPMGLHMNPNNRWIKMADTIPWDEYEKNTGAFSKARLEMLQNHSVWRLEH